MKNLIKFLTLILLLTVIPLASCTEDPEESMGSIIGNVTESPKGTEPLSGVTVSITSTGQSTTTGSNGAFSFQNMAPGTYSLQFSKSGYVSNSRSVTVVAGGEAKCDIQLTKEVEEANLSINPSSLNFGTTQSDMNVTIKNNGNTTATWSIDLGNNPWLSVSQLGGSIQAGRTQSITFSVNRDFLSEARSIVVNLEAFGNTFPISISCAPKSISSEMTIDPMILNFESGVFQQTFTIRNTGTGSLNWSASGLTTEGLSLSASQGTVSAGGSTVVVVTVDRTIITTDLITTFIISDGLKDKTIVVNIKKYNGSNPDKPNDPNNPDNPGDETDPNKIVVANGLSAYYLFNNNFDDAVGEFDGFGVKDPTFVSGISEEAVQFSKTKENAVEIPYGMINTTSFTISFWAKGLSDGLIFYSKCSDNNNRFTLSMYNGNLKFICTVGNNSYYKDYTNENFNFSHSTISSNEWHHITIVADYSITQKDYWVSTLYLDGKRCGSISEKRSITTAYDSETQYPNAFVIGGKTSYGASTYSPYSLVCPNFAMDDLRIYESRCLTASEIKEIYNARQ